VAEFTAAEAIRLKEFRSKQKWDWWK